MNVKIIIDEVYKETIVKIFTNKYSKEIENIKESLEGSSSDKITAFKDDEIKLIDYKYISRFFAENNKIYLESGKDTFTTRLRIYELEDRLPKNKFIKISRSEIVNLDYINRLDLSFTGTIALEMKDGNVTYVSRRNLKNFKKALGL
ncbi:LytTR family transcriptional regulator [Peptoniphilus sp. MSJ-1]|uniref:LytTR family transcriptional regulator n=1 Tax=Peptoniphilus ovalis TaxID=2841503 RepID=A0ABS6FEB4_9FIRM|nr:LytTR family transcriptional regulator [Peptoniphilus ovalis]